MSAQPVVDRLLSRLQPGTENAIRPALNDEAARIWEEALPLYRRYLTLSFGVFFRVPGVLEQTGLSAVEPPEEVHSMARGALAAGGDLYSADLVAEALERAGTGLGRVRRILDFGCSSGRTLRALSAAFPEVEWHGVDPNGPAVGWAAEHLPGAAYAQSQSDPPLAFADAHFDAVYAISIWSHFAAASALAWLDEMHRLIAPGGHLVFTVHGAESVAFYGRRALRPAEQLDEIVKALHSDGFWFAQEFGEDGDHGVADPGWGTAFMSAEWLLRHVTPRWHIVSYEVGRNADNQDVVVLRRAS